MMEHSQLQDTGRTPHHEIDSRLPTPAEKANLEDLINGILELQVDTSNVSNPPTDAQLDTAFGTPATVGTGFTALLDDNGDGNNVYLVASDGTNWWHVALTKAV